MRNSGDRPNNRSITALNKHGHSAHFNQDQYTPDRNVGSVEVAEWTIDLSDQSPSND